MTFNAERGRMSTDPAALVERVRSEVGDALRESHTRLGEATVVVVPERIAGVMSLLREHEQLLFDMLMDLTAVDLLNSAGAPGHRFEVVYHLYSLTHKHRLRVKLCLDAASAVASVTSQWPAADWMEREVFDLYGIPFEGHPDLRRILLYDEFEGHPLRKDYPKTARQPLVGPRD